MSPRPLRPRPLLWGGVSFAILVSACGDAGVGPGSAPGSGDVGAAPAPPPAKVVEDPPLTPVTQEEADKATAFLKPLDAVRTEVRSLLDAHSRSLAPVMRKDAFDEKAMDQTYAATLARLEKFAKDVEAVPDFSDKLGADLKAATLAFVNGWAARLKAEHADVKQLLTAPNGANQNAQPRTKAAVKSKVDDLAKQERDQAGALDEAKRLFVRKYTNVKK